MASNLKLATAAKNAMLDAITTQLGTIALLRIYDGTQPASPDTAITTQTKLAELACSSTFAAAASAGVLTANAITAANAVATGTAAWFRACKSDGTGIVDGTVATSGGDATIDNTSITSGQSVSCTALTITAGN